MTAVPLLEGTKSGPGPVRQIYVMARREWLLTRRDPLIPFLIVVAPLLVLLLLGKPLGDIYLKSTHARVSGGPYAALAPRAALTFSFFGISAVAYAFFRERWFAYTELLESWPVPRRRIVLAKVAVPWVMVFTQFLILSIVPLTLDGRALQLNPVVLLTTAVAAATSVTAIGVLVLSLSKTEAQSGQLQNLIVMLGSIGGGLWVPIKSLARPLQVVAPVFPQYWLNRAISHGVASTVYVTPAVINSGIVVVATTVLLLSAHRIDFRRFRPV